jgi:hypothetical protein
VVGALSFAVVAAAGAVAVRRRPAAVASPAPRDELAGPTDDARALALAQVDRARAKVEKRRRQVKKASGKKQRKQAKKKLRRAKKRLAAADELLAALDRR